MFNTIAIPHIDYTFMCNSNTDVFVLFIFIYLHSGRFMSFGALKFHYRFLCLLV